MNPRSLALASTIAVAVVGGVVAGARATGPADEGRIVFSRYRFVNQPRTAELFVVNPTAAGHASSRTSSAGMSTSNQTGRPRAPAWSSLAALHTREPAGSGRSGTTEATWNA